MSGRLRKTASALLMLSGMWLIPLSAQEQPAVELAVDQIAERALSRNLEILKAARDVEVARRDLAGDPELMDSTLSVGGGYGAAPSRSPRLYGESSLSLQISPQLSAGAAVQVEEAGAFNESLSLTVKPLQPSRQTFSEREVLGRALLRERYLKQRIFLAAEAAALDLLIRDMERDLARRAEELEQNRYQLVQRRQEIGEASFQDVQDQLLALIEARERLFDGEQRYLEAWKTLQLLFAPSEEEIAVKELSMDELIRKVEQREQGTRSLDEAEPVTEELEGLRLELDALEAELESTPLWRPDLNLSASVGFPYQFPDSHSAILSLNISPNQINREEREDLRREIETKRLEIAAETYSARLEKSLEQQRIALAEQALESARIQVQRDALSLEEAEALFQEGRRTTLELEQLRLNLRRARILAFQSAAEVYAVSGQYRLLFLAD